jgi:hypothetical protein
MAPDEAKILLAKQAINEDQFNSSRAAAETYLVNRETLRIRCLGIRSRRDCPANSRILSDLEEYVIIEHILDLDSRGFSPTVRHFGEMANAILASRDAEPVGKNWPGRFVNRQPRLKTRLDRKLNYQRAKQEDPAIVEAWFRCVQAAKEAHGILDDDTYNFDETGFTAFRR